MKVIYHKERAWYLLQEENEYFLDVNCSNSAFGYSILIHLDKHEKDSYIEKGNCFIDNLAKEISFHGLNKYESRNIKKDYASKVGEAIKIWKTNNASTL